MKQKLLLATSLVVAGTGVYSLYKAKKRKYIPTGRNDKTRKADEYFRRIEEEEEKLADIDF